MDRLRPLTRIWAIVSEVNAKDDTRRLTASPQPSKPWPAR